MGDNVYLGDRNGVRTPMQWSGDRNAGFSRADPSQLYQPVLLDPVCHYQAVNVEAQFAAFDADVAAAVAKEVDPGAEEKPRLRPGHAQIRSLREPPRGSLFAAV